MSSLWSSLTGSAKSTEPEVEADDEESLALLLEKFPSSTEAERRRFFKARDCDVEGASKQMEGYFEFREKYSLDDAPDDDKSTDDDDVDDAAVWEYAAKKATAIEDPEGNSIKLPQLTRMYVNSETKEHFRTKDGIRILHFMPAQLDFELAPQNAYSLALAFYLDRKLGRDTMEKLVILIDTRPGLGWKNPPAIGLLPWIKAASGLLNANFPERLSKCLLYPVPTISVYIYEMAKPFLDEATASKIVLICGSAEELSPPPDEELGEFIDDPILKKLEESRFLAFI